MELLSILMLTPAQSRFQMQNRRCSACSGERRSDPARSRCSGGAGRAVGGRQLEGGKARTDFIDIGGAEFRQRRGVIGQPCADLAAERSEAARERGDKIEPTDGAIAERDR